MSDGFHPPVEEYLEAMYELEEAGVPVIRARLAERLGHAAPSVTEMVRRLVEAGYVVAAGRKLSMTDAGRSRAESVVRKHRLAERLLTDVIGLEWHKIHREAGRWEHVISDDVEARLIEILDNPGTCPHGNPIPGGPKDLRQLTPLNEVHVGSTVRLERVSETIEMEYDSLAYLDEHGFRPGSEAKVKKVGPDGSVVLDVGGATVQLEAHVAANLHVTADGQRVRAARTMAGSTRRK